MIAKSKPYTYYVLLSDYDSNARLRAKRFLIKHEFVALSNQLFALYPVTETSIWDDLERLLYQLQLNNVDFELIETTTHRRESFLGRPR